MIYELVPNTDPILKQKLDLFDFNHPPTDPNQLAHDITQSVIHYQGWGLAANQLGLPYRVFVINSDPKFVCFNPRIVDQSTEEVKMLEGCLSFPKLTLNIQRFTAIRARFTLPNGETITKDFTGATSRIFQHELDHLNGILFTTKISRLELDIARRKANKKK